MTFKYISLTVYCKANVYKPLGRYRPLGNAQEHYDDYWDNAINRDVQREALTGKCIILIIVLNMLSKYVLLAFFSRRPLCLIPNTGRRAPTNFSECNL